MSQTDTHASPNANLRTRSPFFRYSFSDDDDQPLSPEDEKSNPPSQDPIVTRSPRRFSVALESSLKSGRSCRILLRIVATCVFWTLLKWVATVCGINKEVLGAVDDILRAITCVALAIVGTSTYMELEGKMTLVASPVAIIEEPIVTIATPPQESHPVVHADGDTQVPQTNVPEGSNQTNGPTSSLPQVDIDKDRGLDHLQMQSTEQRQSSTIDSEHHNQETPQTGISTTEIPPKPDSSTALFTVIMRRHKYIFSKFDEFVANPNFAFTNEDQAALRNLHLGLKAYKARFFARSGRHFRPISVRLVSVDSSSQGHRAHLGASNPLETCICITGLKMLKEIQEFDKIMSREGYENLYSPLKLCYEQSHIIRSAGSGSYNINPSGTETLCGSLVVFEDSDGLQRKSTVGGMVEIDDQTFGLTTSHRPEDDMFPDNDVPSLADLIRAFGDEEDHVSEPAQHASSSVPLTTQQEDDEGLDTPASRASHSTRDLVKGSSGKSAISLYSDDTWDDWDLLPIEPANRLPNTVPTSKSRAYSPKGIKRSGKYIYVVSHFDRMSFDNAMPWSVFIISGMSGIVDGFLSSSPSYTLSGLDGPQEL
ncbi:hypothetical protein CCUS01_02939 [Colletotrichum cuscutae]|uniref:Uncharacterized protein n=1 Tax=Colletotrichum cuscutae TaxID=1209917 RepID=A0AAJ0DN12_9PEZI|nr:hypothetical protein CCUS01_02939 [Colletotrichum cuscutae]